MKTPNKDEKLSATNTSFADSTKINKLDYHNIFPHEESPVTNAFVTGSEATLQQSSIERAKQYKSNDSKEVYGNLHV